MDALLVTTAACMLMSYLVCGIPFGLIVGKHMGGIDVREEGSGNIGMTNVARTVGSKAALITFACDVGKGFLCVLVSRILIGLVAIPGASMSPTGTLFASLTLVYACCVTGHVLSPYLGFKGGKGISVGFGAALALYWPIAFVMLVVFFVMVLPTHYISLGSLVAAITLPVQCLVFWRFTLWSTLPIIVAVALVVWAHRENVVRLIHGEENTFTIHIPDAAQRKRKVDPTERKED